MPSINAHAFASTAQRSYRLVVNQPGWVVRSVLLTAGAVLIVTLLVVVIPALLIGAVVLLGLSAIGAGVRGVKRLLGGPRAGELGGGGGAGRDEGGRENVRVMRRDS